jgi:hypothetical protein
MGKFFLDTGITLSNQAWKLTGKKAAGEPGLKLELPEEPLEHMCSATLREVHERVAMPFGVRFRSRWLRATGDSAAADSTESAFASLLLRFTDPALAREVIRIFYLNRSLEGRMPLAIRPFTSSSLPAYPFTLLALSKYHDISLDNEGTRELFLKYLKFSDWLVINHKGDGGLYYHNDETWFRRDFLVKPLIDAEPLVATRWRDTLSLGLNCVMAWQYRILSRCAIGGGENRDARKLDNHAKKLAAFIHESFWNNDHKFYFDKLSGEPVLTPSALGLLPLAAEAATRLQAEALVSRLDQVTAPLCDTLDHAPYNAVTALLIMDGLSKYGYHTKAAALALKLARATAALQGARNSLVARTIATHALLEYVLGFVTLGPKRFVIFPRLPQSWTGKPGRIAIAPHNVALDFSLTDTGSVATSIAHPYGPDFSLSQPNNSVLNVDLQNPPAPRPEPRQNPPAANGERNSS